MAFVEDFVVGANGEKVVVAAAAAAAAVAVVAEIDLERARMICLTMKRPVCLVAGSR